ncbi:MAG TPA: aldo/keto reductase [Lentisphaeria bacterium]|nr:aldo/keto reductase [Lentisphaeria bacterium]
MSTIRKRPLGATGMQVSELGLGTWPLGGVADRQGALNYGDCPEKDALDIIAAYVDAGGNHLDSAYNYWGAEARIGKYLKSARNRDHMILTSKIWPVDEAAVRQCLDQSRRDFGTDVIDVLYLHNPPDDVDEMNRVLDLYCRLKDEGKIRAIGATIKGHNVTSETVRLMRQYIASGRTDVIMCIFSALRQKTGQAFAEAHAAGVGIVLRTTLESGFLTGAFKPGHVFAGPQDHRARWPRKKLDQILELVEAFNRAVVKPPYRTTAEVATRFALDTPHVSSVLQGVLKVSELRENLTVLDLPALDEHTMALIRGQFGHHETTVSLDL